MTQSKELKRTILGGNECQIDGKQGLSLTFDLEFTHGIQIKERRLYWENSGPQNQFQK